MSDIELNTDAQAWSSPEGLTEPQFDIFGREEDYGQVRLIATGYSHADAEGALNVLNEKLRELFGDQRFGMAAFMMKRRRPVIQTVGAVSVGDFILCESKGPTKVLAHGCGVYSSLVTIWRVVEASGASVEVEHVDGTRKSVKTASVKWFDSSQLEGESVWMNLVERHAQYIKDGHRCFKGGFFDGEKSVRHYLMGYLKPISKTDINGEAVELTVSRRSERYAKHQVQGI
jgi:hypothetical protein